MVGRGYAGHAALHAISLTKARVRAAAGDDQGHATRINEICACSKVKCQRIHTFMALLGYFDTPEYRAASSAIVCGEVRAAASP
jgi:hypothetical protein